ncbi:protein serine/threonine phosphatase [Candidatus Vecturithrix granuli]|uniref:Protein serine/threonine phosphatase n=1 Tax=Vecturithrix granuli TaxID=1499967 RepID=A0A081C4E3_VECG1|nr:protein serine/threonine phosphatase [Candidatus Vecturithrix granuli]
MMKNQIFHWIRNQSLKTKLCLLTVLLVGIIMLSVGSIVINQQQKALWLQMEETGRFLVKNLAKNVVAPLLEGDNLSLNNLITSLEARDQIVAENPARFTIKEFETFLHQFFLENKIQPLRSLIDRKYANIYIHVEHLSVDQIKPLAAAVFHDVVNIVNDLKTQEQYNTFFQQYPWTRSIVESLTTLTDLGVAIHIEDISKAQREDLTSKLAERIFNEILGYVKNPFIGYAIVLDKEGIIQAHPDIEQLGQSYFWPEGTTRFNPEEDATKINHHVLFKGEPHIDLASPVFVRDKNIGRAYIGSVHVGLREDSIQKDVNKAKQRIMYITLIAILLGSAGAYALASLVVKPIKNLVHDAEILGGGDLDSPIQVSTFDEVGVLAKTLDDARIKLKDAQQRLIASERLARELEIAREIQMALLPRDTPMIDRVEVGALYRAAAQVGGDLYDFFWVSEEELGIVVADVSGKGIPGSLMMTMAKAVIRAKAVKSDELSHKLPSGNGGDPASVIRKTNQMISQDIRKGMFITANYGILNIHTLRFRFVSAGHNATLVYNSRTGDLYEYNPKGIALGLDKGTIFDAILQNQDVSLSSGDLLLQYTDGITEAMNQQQEEFGEERLKEAIQKYAHQNVNEFLASLDQEIRAFTEGFAQSDDITAIAIKVK